MANMNISDLMGSNTDNSTSALFSGLGTGSASGSQSNIFNNINLNDYNSVKNGSYYKVMKKYYSDAPAEASDEEIETYKKKQSATADKSAELAASLNDLIDQTYSEENKDDIVSSIDKFAAKYNSMLSNASDSDSKSIRQQADWLANIVKEHAGSLDKVGITVNSDGSLSVDKDKLKQADTENIKNIFGVDVNNLAGKILYKAEQIYSLAKTYGTSATAYTSNGTYKRNYSGSSYNTTT